MRFELTRLFWWIALIVILFGAIRLAFAVPSTAISLIVLGGALVLARVGLGSTRLVRELATAFGLLALLNRFLIYQSQELPPIDYYHNLISYALRFAAAGAVLGLVASGLLTIGNGVVQRFEGERKDI